MYIHATQSNKRNHQTDFFKSNISVNNIISVINNSTVLFVFVTFCGEDDSYGNEHLANKTTRPFVLLRLTS